MTARCDLSAALEQARMMRPRLIGFCGAAGAGKTHAATLLARDWGYSRVRFAGPLKAMLHALGLTEADTDGAAKDQPADLLGGRTPRHAMQTLGTEWGRALISPDCGCAPGSAPPRAIWIRACRWWSTTCDSSMRPRRSCASAALWCGSIVPAPKGSPASMRASGAGDSVRRGNHERGRREFCARGRRAGADGLGREAFSRSAFSPFLVACARGRGRLAPGASASGGLCLRGWPGTTRGPTWLARVAGVHFISRR